MEQAVYYQIITPSEERKIHPSTGGREGRLASFSTDMTLPERVMGLALARILFFQDVFSGLSRVWREPALV